MASKDALLSAIRQASSALREAERPVRILSSLSWGPEVRERFLASGATELPQIEYPRLDAGPVLEQLGLARKIRTGEPVLDAWLDRLSDSIARGARMLASTGTPNFFEHSRTLYGAPRDIQPDQSTTALDLALQLEKTITSLNHVDLGVEEHRLSAEAASVRIRNASEKFFGPLAPDVAVVDRLSANALAGPRHIRLLGSAHFSDRDVEQLIQHEAYIHVATSLNGAAQVDVPILAASHGGTTRTQEGLAVFSEFISGTMDLDRLERLADRVLAIQMAIEGADFIEVYQFFLSQSDQPESSFEQARRVFRGGVLTGGAPFTKDIVYLDGLLRVHDFLRSAVSTGRADGIKLLFCGKLDIEDLPAVFRLCELGLVKLPRFLPPWASDLRFLLSYLAYASFLHRVDFVRVREHYREMLAHAPRLPS